MKYVVKLTFVGQIGPDSWGDVTQYLGVGDDTKVSEIMKWAAGIYGNDRLPSLEIGQIQTMHPADTKN